MNGSTQEPMMPIAPARPGGPIAGVWQGQPAIYDPTTGQVTNQMTGAVLVPGTLPMIPTLPQIRQAAASVGSQIGQAATAAGAAVSKAAQTATTPLGKWFGVNLEDIVFVLLGLILIAAAAFSFKPTQTVVREFSRSAVKAAAES